MQKSQSLKNLKETATKQRTHFFKPFNKKIIFSGFKMFSFRCKSHVQEIITKKHVWLSIEIQFGIFLNFTTFLAMNQNIHTQLCTNVKTHHCHMNYLKLSYLIFLT
jgi:hypothetical protein